MTCGGRGAPAVREKLCTQIELEWFWNEMRCRGREPHTAATGALPRFRLLMGLTGLFLAVNVLSMAAPGAAVLCISRMLAALLWVLPRSVGAMERKEPFFRQFSVLRDRRCSNPGDRALRPFFSWRF